MDNEQTTESEVVNEQPTTTNVSQTLQAMVFGGEVSSNQNGTENGVHETQAAATTTAEVAPTANEETDILEPNTYLKNKWGWETEEAADNEIKSLREKASKAFEYKNDDSRKLAEYINEGKEDELYKFLDTKKRVEKLATSELTDKNIAAELVKFGIQKDNPQLDASEVEFLFYEKYAIPEKPIQGEFEDEADYAAKLNVWQLQATNAEKRLIIEAKMQQPKLAQLKTELVLPEIQRNNQPQQQQRTQEELAAFAKERETFLQSATQSINSFNGFSEQVKDKDVDYSVAYTPSQEERALINAKIQKFAQSGFDANAVFADEWVEADGKTINVKKMTEDLSNIYLGKSARSKMAFDSGNKRLEAYLKDKKQIDIVKQPQGTFTLDKGGAANVSEKLQELVFG